MLVNKWLLYRREALWSVSKLEAARKAPKCPYQWNVYPRSGVDGSPAAVDVVCRDSWKITSGFSIDDNDIGVVGPGSGDLGSVTLFWALSSV